MTHPRQVVRWILWTILIVSGTLRILGAGYVPATRALVGDFAAVFPTRYLATWLRPDFPTEQVWQGWYYGPMLHVMTLPLFLVPRWSFVPAVWATINLIVVAVSFVLLLKLSRNSPRSLFSTGLIAALWMLYQPLVNCLAQGNIEIVELALILWALVSLSTSRGALPGVILGIAAMTKFLPIGFLGWLLMRRRWRAAFSGAATIAAIVLLTAVTLGWENSGSLRDMSWALSTPIAGPQQLSITSMFLHRSGLLLGNSEAPGPTPFSVWVPAQRAEAAADTGAIVSLLLAVGIAVALFRHRRQPVSSSEIAVLFMTMFMILPWNHDYYYVFALVPISLLLLDAVARGDKALLAATLVGYLLISPPIPFSWIDRAHLLAVRFTDLYGFLDLPIAGAMVLWVAAMHRVLVETDSGSAPPWMSTRRVVLVGTVALVAITVAARASTPWTHPVARPVTDVQAIDPPIDVSGEPALAVSADGAYLAYVALQTNVRTLCVHRIDAATTTCLAGTEHAAAPFFSPDNRWVGFVAGPKLNKVAVAGDQPVTTIGESLGARSAEWATDGTILLATRANGVVRLSASGGRMDVVIPSPTAALALASPTLLPSGNTVVGTVLLDADNLSVGNLTAVSLRTGRRTRLFPGTAPHFDAHTGRLSYVVGGRVMSVRFDPVTLAWAGPSMPVVSNVLVTADGGPFVAHGAQGAVAYVTGGPEALASRPLMSGATTISIARVPTASVAK